MGVQLNTTTIQETFHSRKEAMDSLLTQERKSSSTQNSRRSSELTLMPLVSMKNQRLKNGLVIAKDKPRETKKRESLKRKRELPKRKDSPRKLKKRRKLKTLLRRTPSRSTSKCSRKKTSPSMLVNQSMPRRP